MALFTAILLFTLQAFIEAGNETSVSSESVLTDIKTQLNIASQIIETAKQKIPEDMKDLCKEFKGYLCENKTYNTEPLDCSDIYLSGQRKDGLYNIWPQSGMYKRSLRVYCDMESDGGGWTVIQRRGDYERSQDYFYREWSFYKYGFGDMMKDFWIGNDNLFSLTNQRLYELRVNLTAWEGDSAYAKYSEFWVSDETLKYKLHVTGFSGTAGDSLKKHDGMSFSTKDRDNTIQGTKCAEKFLGAWWFENCMDSDLNGLYLRGPNPYFSGGIVWQTFKGYQHSLRSTVMKIRPLPFQN